MDLRAITPATFSVQLRASRSSRCAAMPAASASSVQSDGNIADLLLRGDRRRQHGLRARPDLRRWPAATRPRRRERGPVTEGRRPPSSEGRPASRRPARLPAALRATTATTGTTAITRRSAHPARGQHRRAPAQPREPLQRPRPARHRRPEDDPAPVPLPAQGRRDDDVDGADPGGGRRERRQGQARRHREGQARRQEGEDARRAGAPDEARPRDPAPREVAEGDAERQVRRRRGDEGRAGEREERLSSGSSAAAESTFLHAG